MGWGWGRCGAGKPEISAVWHRVWARRGPYHRAAKREVGFRVWMCQRAHDAVSLTTRKD